MSLVAASGFKAINCLENSSFLKGYIQFWQTWANLEIAGFLYESDLIPNNIKKIAYEKATKEWSQYDETK